jgi:putative DNA primase/helicase
VSESAELLALLKAKGCDVVPDFTGALVRGGHNNRYWFVGNRHVSESGAVHYFANFGDWRTGEEWTWESDIPLDAKEAEALRAAMDGQKKKVRQDRERLNDEMAAQTEVFLANECVYKGFSPYLEKKGFAPGELFGVGIATKFDATLTVIPYRDVTGKVWGYQTIDEAGEKRFLAGAKIQGNFFQMGEMTEVGYICEGVATGAAIRLASG